MEKLLERDPTKEDEKARSHELQLMQMIMSVKQPTEHVSLPLSPMVSVDNIFDIVQTVHVITSKLTKYPKGIMHFRALCF